MDVFPSVIMRLPINMLSMEVGGWGLVGLEPPISSTFGACCDLGAPVTLKKWCVKTRGWCLCDELCVDLVNYKSGVALPILFPVLLMKMKRTMYYDYVSVDLVIFHKINPQQHIMWSFIEQQIILLVQWLTSQSEWRSGTISFIIEMYSWVRCVISSYLLAMLIC